LATQKDFKVKNGLIVGGDITASTINSKHIIDSAQVVNIIDATFDSDNVSSMIASSFSTNTTDDLSEGSSNLYYTTSRADSDFDARLATKSTTNVSEGSNLYYTTSRADSDFDARLAVKDTDDLTEGNNLYYTNDRARAAVSVTDAGGDGSLAYNSSTGVITYTGPSASEVRAHFSAGTGVTLSSGQISIGQSVGTSDSVTFSGLTVSGDLTVTGTTTQINTVVYTITDPLLHLADSNETSDTVDIGFIGHYSDDGGTTKKHTGLFRDASDDKFYLFNGLVDSGLDSSVPTNVINRSGTGYTNADLQIGNLYLNGTQITASAAEINYSDGVTSNIQTQLDNKDSDWILTAADAAGNAVAMAIALGG